MTRTTARLGRLAGALAAGTLVLAGCSDDSSHVADHGSTTSSSDASAGALEGPEGTVGEADVAFVQGMLPHHQGAIEMAQIAEGRAADPRVLDLASRIEAAQQPEIETLTGWLEDWGVEADAPDGGMDHGSTDHGSTEHTGGMVSEQDTAALVDASGGEFDRLFLEQMIEHHRGAVGMADTEIADGRNADAIAMAESIRGSQSAEIAEMQQLLEELGS